MQNHKYKSVKSLSGTRGVTFAFLIVIGLIQAVLTVLFALAVKNLINAAEYNKGSEVIITSAVYLAVCVSLIFVFSVVLTSVPPSAKSWRSSFFMVAFIVSFIIIVFSFLILNIV